MLLAINITGEPDKSVPSFETSTEQRRGLIVNKARAVIKDSQKHDQSMMLFIFFSQRERESHKSGKARAGKWYE